MILRSRNIFEDYLEICGFRWNHEMILIFSCCLKQLLWWVPLDEWFWKESNKYLQFVTSFFQDSLEREGTILVSHYHFQVLINFEIFIRSYALEISTHIFKCWAFNYQTDNQQISSVDGTSNRILTANVMLHVINLTNCGFELALTVALEL